MQSITLKHSPPSTFVSRLTDAPKTIIENDHVSLDTDFIKGHFTALSFKSGIQCLISQYKLKQDFHLHKIPSVGIFFILRIDEIQDSINSLVEVDGKYTSLQNKSYASTLLSSKQESTFICTNNSRIRSIEITLPVKWLEKKMIRRGALKLFYSYLNSNGIDVQFNVNDIDIKPHFSELFDDANKGMRDLDLYEKTINLLLEDYMMNLNEKLIQKINEQKTKIAKDEITRLIAVKDYLIRDPGAPPPAFSTLTALAAMSSTSLKTKFKKMFGANLFELFQRNRMQKARVLLLTKRYSIKEIGRQLGYVNLSNFSIAFKKEFGELPSEVAKSHKKLSFADT